VVHAAVKQQKKVMDLTQGQDIWELIRRGQTEDHADRSQILERGDVAIWKLNEFDLSSLQINSFIDTARKHQTLILDLRGNPGGFEDTLRTMLGSVFDHEVKIADRITRKEKDNKPVKSSHFASIFKGKLIVLIDSHSASCSELFARVVQLEHRGTVIGDQSAGAVMEAMDYSETMGMDTISLYGFSITHANLIMADGKSLENVGVTPDELMLPTADDLAAGRDPVLSHAADLGGLKLDPVEAGKMFPYEWLPL
jgi:C-terminal processing protease CtpA/Prc